MSLSLGSWFARWRRDNGHDAEAPLTPHQELLIALIASGDWLLVLGGQIVKAASKNKPSPAAVRRIAAGLHAAGKLLDDAANRCELGTKGLKA